MNSTWKRRIVPTLALIAITTMVGGCATSGGDADGPVTLTVWDYGYFADDNQRGLEAIDAAFEAANLDITINHIGVPYNTFAGKFNAAIAAQSGPDIVSVYPGIFAAEFAQGLTDLSEIVTPELKNEVDFLDISVAPNGKLYAVPFTTYGFSYFTNKALLAEAGITESPTSWDELIRSCRQLRAAGIEPISSGWQDGYLLDWFFYIFLDMLLTDDELGELGAANLPVNSEPFNAAMGLIAEMNDAGCFAEGGAGRQIVDFQDQFKQGNAAMVLDIGLPSQLNDYADAIGEENVDVFAPPMVPGAALNGPLIDAGPNSGFGITTWATSTDAASKYIAFLLSSEAQTIMWELNDRLPNNNTVPLSSDWETAQKLLDFYQFPENRTTYLAFPASVMAEMESRASAFMAGTVTGAEITNAMEDVVSKLRPGLQK